MAYVHSAGREKSRRTRDMIVAQDAKTFQEPISGATIRLTAVAICATFWVGVACYFI